MASNRIDGLPTWPQVYKLILYICLGIGLIYAKSDVALIGVAALLITPKLSLGLLARLAPSPPAAIQSHPFLDRSTANGS